MGLTNWVGGRAVHHGKGIQEELVGQQGRSELKYFIKF